jgi:alpha-glucosidase
LNPVENMRWWQKAIVYQIYPRSLQDSNGDGIGDLPGILQRLDYLKGIHVDALWLSPINPSPMHDFGYDVADYTGVDPIFGSLDDFMRLLNEAHARDLKIILDLVPNHTSDEHPWFMESRASRTNPKRDWYIWSDPTPSDGPNGGLPNNWLSFFGGPAWTLDPATGQYYLHQFDTHQPELNYRNPEVLEAMLADMRVWLERGIDGFRVDVIWLMIKDAALRDEPPLAGWGGGAPHRGLDHIYTGNQPEVHAIIRAMRALLDEFSAGGQERVLMGETYLPNEVLAEYYGTDSAATGVGDECHLPFNFQLIGAVWNAQGVRKMVDDYEASLPAWGWPNWVLGNHDRIRLATRVGPDQARVATMLLLTLRGTPTCYYGDEIGMHNVEIPAELVRDPQAVNLPDFAAELGRDPVRTPMQWDDSPNAGFCAPDVIPWLPLADDYAQNNVLVQESDPQSPLWFYRVLADLRSKSPALLAGAYSAVDAGADNVFAYLRAGDEQRFLIVLNFSAEAQVVNLSAVAAAASVLVDTALAKQGDLHFLRNLRLGPNEGLVLSIDAAFG